MNSIHSVDLNFAPRFRPFHEEALSGYVRTLDSLVYPGELCTLSSEPRLHLKACRLRAGGVVVSVESTPLAVRHRQEHACEPGRAEFLATFVIQGTGLASQSNTALAFEAGDILFRTTAMPSDFQMHSDTRLVVIKAPIARLLGSSAQHTHSFSAMRAKACMPMAQTAQRTLAHVFFDENESNPTSVFHAEQSLMSLLAAIYTSQAPEQLSQGERVQVDAWQALTAYIDANITDPELSLLQISSSLRVSTRWIHRLFQARSLQYGNYVREKRLQLAQVALRDASQAQFTVREIAHHCGFQDASHFSRSFSRRFGTPPHQYRAMFSAEVDRSALAS